MLTLEEFDVIMLEIDSIQHDLHMCESARTYYEHKDETELDFGFDFSFIPEKNEIAALTQQCHDKLTKLYAKINVEYKRVGD
jgi:hypothetical protein